MSANPNFEIFLGRLVKRLCRELNSEKNESLALRKALLGLSFVTATYEHEPTRMLVRYLLTKFPHLVAHFNEDQHPLLKGHNVRLDPSSETAELQVQEKLLSSIMRKAVDVEDLAYVTSDKWPWEQTTERYVGFFDIMGFRAFVARHGGNHDAVLDTMESMQEICRQAENTGVLLFPNARTLNYPGCWIRLVQFSDSILAVTRDLSQTSGACMALASQFIFGRALQCDTSVRGGIAAGLTTADFSRSLYFGQPIIDAYLLQENQAWHGVAYHRSTQIADSEFGNQPPNSDGVPPDGWLPVTSWHEVPSKLAEPLGELQVTNWALLFDTPEILDQAIAHLRIEHDPKLMAYYEATRSYGRKMLREMGRMP